MTQMGNTRTVYSEAQVVAEGLEIEMLETLDLMYQVVPDYDDKENVVTGWDGDRFLYLIEFNKLPPQWLNAQIWIDNFASDIRSASRSDAYQMIDCGCQKSSGGFYLCYILISYILEGEQDRVVQLVCHMSDRQNAYSAIATPVSERGRVKLAEEVLSILKTSRAPASNVVALNRMREERYFGAWRGDYTDEFDRVVTVEFRLMEDLTFVCKKVIADESDGVYAGIWSISKNVISWQYLYGRPAMQVDKSTEVDEIRSFTGDTLLLVSLISGRELKLSRLDQSR